MDAPEVRGGLGESRSAVSALWIAPKDAVAWLIVAHGAGAGMDHPFLAGFCRAMAEHGVATARFNFSYMDSGRRSPDPEPSLRAAWNEAFTGVQAMGAGLPMLAGGKSLGGRIASMCVADGMPVAGLVFLGYPSACVPSTSNASRCRCSSSTGRGTRSRSRSSSRRSWRSWGDAPSTCRSRTATTRSTSGA